MSQPIDDNASKTHSYTGYANYIYEYGAIVVAMYAYKYVLNTLPDDIVDTYRGSHGELPSCDYDGDLWYAAHDYITRLQIEITGLRNKVQTLNDKQRN